MELYRRGHRRRHARDLLRRQADVNLQVVRNAADAAGARPRRRGSWRADAGEQVVRFVMSYAMAAATSCSLQRLPPSYSSRACTGFGKTRPTAPSREAVEEATGIGFIAADVYRRGHRPACRRWARRSTCPCTHLQLRRPGRHRPRRSLRPRARPRGDRRHAGRLHASTRSSWRTGAHPRRGGYNLLLVVDADDRPGRRRRCSTSSASMSTSTASWSTSSWSMLAVVPAPSVPAVTASPSSSPYRREAGELHALD